MTSTPSHAERRLRFTIPPDQAGRTLLNFLHARFPYFPDAGWLERIDRHRLLINGADTHPDHPLVTGDLIEYLDWDVPEPEVNLTFSIIHREDTFIVIDKPAGLPCHPGGRYLHNSLTMQIQKQLQIEAPILVNRLDRETSGLILVALDRRTAKALQQQFAQREVSKRYLVFVERAFPETLSAEGYIVPDTDSVVRKRRRFIRASEADPTLADAPDADWAVTHFTRRRTNGIISEVEARPTTGRQHQIRATLCGLGFPVVGDKLYGVDPVIFLRFCNGTLTPDDHAHLRLDRQALHAAALRFRHPQSRRTMDLEAPLPADLQALADTLA